jgi:flagellar biosynthesis GTPase FlhF
LVIFIAVVLGCTCQSSSNSNSTQSKPASNSTTAEKPSEKATPKIADSSESNESSDDTSESASNSDSDFDKEMDDLSKKIEDLKKQTENLPKPGNPSKTASPKDDSFDEEPPPPASNKIPTMSQYRQIRQGMSYNEVVGILGNKGSLIKQEGAMKRFIWGDDSSFIMISFQNDRVNIATQENLK